MDSSDDSMSFSYEYEYDYDYDYDYYEHKKTLDSRDGGLWR